MSSRDERRKEDDKQFAGFVTTSRQGDDDADIIQAVLKGKFSFDDDAWESVSKEAKDLIKKMITKPEIRLNAQECLDHKWFSKK